MLLIRNNIPHALGAVHKRRQQKIAKIDPLPPCLYCFTHYPCGHTITFEKFESFCNKKYSSNVFLFSRPLTGRNLHGYSLSLSLPLSLSLSLDRTFLGCSYPFSRLFVFFLTHLKTHPVRKISTIEKPVSPTATFLWTAPYCNFNEKNLSCCQKC